MGTPDAYGDIITIGTGAGLTTLSVYYLDSSQVWQLADANSGSTSSGILALALGSTPSAGMLVRGYARNNTFTGSNGNKLYLNPASSGFMTTTIPSGTGDIVRIVAYIIDASTRTIYFNPDNTYIELI